MKKNNLLLILVLLIAGVAVFLYMQSKQGTINEELRDFAVKDTGSVTKMFLANKSGQQTLLEKKTSGDWVMNGKTLARQDAVKTLLASLHDIEVRSPVGKKAYNNVIKTIAANGIKVELYNSNGLLKTIYVGGPTQDQLGTFMYLENSTVPFITHIPGFDGYLTPRFIVNEEEWRVKNVFRLNDGSLKSLSVTDRQQKDKSFTITQDQKGNYSLSDGEAKNLGNVSQDKIINYLQSYRMLNYEMNEKSLTPEQKDSVKATSPFRTIVLVDETGKSTQIDFWRRPLTGSTVNKALEDGTPFPYDVDRMIGSINKDPELIVVQYFSFEKLFRRPADFLVQ
ncbi:MAG: DUF4340 domain-containing protein [Bacteroidota bacterium]|nr:DUF4340 domain-containing protein [Bacteroidota bacterium]